MASADQTNSTPPEPSEAPPPTSRIGQVFFGSRELVRIVHRDPGHVAERPTRMYQTVGVTWLGALGAVIALSLVIADQRHIDDHKRRPNRPATDARLELQVPPKSATGQSIRVCAASHRSNCGADIRGLRTDRHGEADVLLYAPGATKPVQAPLTVGAVQGDKIGTNTATVNLAHDR